jgi:hypothetical protein
VKRALLAIVFLLSAACGSSTLHGSVTLTTSDGLSRSGSACSGTGGYEDLTGGAPVTITNESGAIIATGSLDAGVSDATYPTVVCHFAYTISNVPAAKFYTVEVSHRGGLTYSQEQLDANGWKSDATIGS